MKSWDQIHVPVFPQNPLRHFSYFSIESAFSPRFKKLLPARVSFYVNTVSPVIGHLGKPEWPQVTGFALPEIDHDRLYLVCCTENVWSTGPWVCVLGLWAGSFICFESEPCNGGREKAEEVQRWEGVGVSSERPAGSARLGAALHSDLSDPPSSTERPDVTVRAAPHSLTLLRNEAFRKVPRRSQEPIFN